MAASKQPKDVPVPQVAEEAVPEKEDGGKAKVDILLCLLCDKTVRVPKCLPCLHSFCDPCLTTYVENIIKRSKGKIEIVCPECRMVVYHTLERMNGKAYTDSLPTGTVCSSLLCEPAIKENACHFNDGCNREPAVWCGYCANSLCLEHTELHRMLTTMKIFHPTIELQDALKVKHRFQKCVHHPKEDMAYFCPRDWTTCCNICGKVQHKTCFFMNRGVMPIADIANEIKESHTTQSLKPTLESLEIEAKELSDDRQKNLDRLELQHEKGRENIVAFREAMNEHLDKLEKNLNDELDNNYEKVKANLQHEKMIIDTRLRTVQYYEQMLEAIHAKSTNVQAVTELSKLREQMDNVQCDVQQRKRNLKKTDLSVHPLPDLEKALPKLGSVQIKEFGRQLGHWTLRKSKTTLLN